MMTQIEVEERMYDMGIARAKAATARNEESGEAARNPYAATIFQDFVHALAKIIQQETAPTGKAGQARTHVVALRPLDPMAVAYLTVRVILNKVMGGKHTAGKSVDGVTVRYLANEIGKAVHSELVLAVLAEKVPELYHTLANDFARRRSKSERHRMTVFKMQARANGVEVPEWGATHRDVVGLWLLGQCRGLGLVLMEDINFEVNGRKVGSRRPAAVCLAPDVMATIDQINGFVEVNRPAYGPCVEPPLDWVAVDHGGFHTEKMRRRHKYLVKARAGARELLKARPMGRVLQAVNALQRTSWAVNEDILRTLERASAAGLEFGEIVADAPQQPKPMPPEWLATIGDADRTPYQLAEFKEWKREMTEWYTQQKLRGLTWGRYRSAISTARTFRDYSHLYFTYFLDSRGRAYPLTYGVNPQGSDLQKALLRFAEGKALHDEAAVDWFLINGANRWGFDKATLQERAAWALERADQIIAMADDPINNRDWTQADKPLQFLAWAIEFRDWSYDQRGFKSHLPVGLDGSCNGLQHFSAMLRDEVGGEATNLMDLKTMQDIYQRVADRAVERLESAAPDDNTPVRQMWLSHGVGRYVVKRSVMTTPYGVTKRAAVRYVQSDYLEPNKVFEKSERGTAAAVLMESAWPAIGDVVVKAREGMEWLHKSARIIIKNQGEDSDGVLSWETPSGFLATQSYYEPTSQRVKIMLLDTEVRIKCDSESDDVSISRHSTGLAPNFVHSMDAAHMHMVAAAAGSLGIDALAMIHDDFGTHAADTQKFFMLIRVMFHDMYTAHDPIMDFHRRYPETPEPPEKGDLDLSEVLRSDFFFS
jgi:DNA-directed RNA polymerase